MEITDFWQVGRLAVVSVSSSTQGITSWGVYVDGCTSAAVQPHILECMEQMQLTAKNVRPGKMSPFFTVVSDPSRMTVQTMRAFAEILSGCDIRGLYCDAPGKVMIIEYFDLVRVTGLAPIDGGYRVTIQGDKALFLGQLRNHVFDTFTLQRAPDRCSIVAEVKATDVEALRRELRLFASLGQLRWDGYDPATRDLLGKPLI